MNHVAFKNWSNECMIIIDKSWIQCLGTIAPSKGEVPCQNENEISERERERERKRERERERDFTIISTV